MERVSWSSFCVFVLRQMSYDMRVDILSKLSSHTVQLVTWSSPYSYTFAWTILWCWLYNANSNNSFEFIVTLCLIFIIYLRSMILNVSRDHCSYFEKGLDTTNLTCLFCYICSLLWSFWTPQTENTEREPTQLSGATWTCYVPQVASSATFMCHGKPMTDKSNAR